MLVSLLPLFQLQTSALPSQRCGGRIAILLFPSSPTTSLQKPMWPLSQTGLIFFLVFYHKERKLLEDNDSWLDLCTSSFSTHMPLWYQCCFSPAVPWGYVNGKAASRMKPRKSQLITACAVSCVDNELLIIGENEVELEDLALNKYRLEMERFLTIKLARIWSILR